LLALALLLLLPAAALVVALLLLLAAVARFEFDCCWRWRCLSLRFWSLQRRVLNWMPRRN
jgi:hypothetical protein